jgi:glycosyltransferase involved in cell wall biosynthesis
MDLVGTPTAAFAAEVPGAGTKRPVALLPCGIDVERFRPLDRRTARERLGLRPDGRYLLFPYDPGRPVKRADRARELAAASGAELLTLGRTEPDDVPAWMNAANAVVCPADWETFGLACLEALACDVPVLARPTGAHAEALAGIAGTHCGEWDLEAWSAALAPHLDDPDPRVGGRDRALGFSAAAMAERVAVAWRWLASEGPPPPLYSRPEAPTDSRPGARSL